MNGSDSDFQFSPLPAPYAMKWDHLMPPVQRAVRDLLKRINGSEKSREGLGDPKTNKKKLGNCFLVYGSRGTGKTTVLLSAKDAINQKSKDAINQEPRFFNISNESDLKKDAESSANSLKNVICLDVLDLESLPNTANLLTTLLTRILKAVESSDCRNEGAALTSILEECEDSARQQLSHLINDATQMWEDIKETDAREIAIRQVKAADIYASFQCRFNTAMDTLSEELGRRGRHEKGCSIVLPIDNIDRSTDHLQAIVKLAQMVSHRCLWLVMAGDRVEIETFLERAYWKELIHSRDGADARGKMRGGSEDETLVMARRQAIATTQRLWPTTHRVEIHMMKPEETLNFCPPDENNAETIYQLLAKVAIPTSSQQRMSRSQDEKNGIHLIELFDMYGKVPKPFRLDDIKDASSLIEKLSKPSDKSIQTISNFIWEKFNDKGREELLKPSSEEKKKKRILVEKLNSIIQNEDIWSEQWFEDIKLRPETRARIDKKANGKIMPELKRMLLEDAYPREIELNIPPLTRAAQHGLSLPVRSLLDLWRLAHWVIKDPIEFTPDFKAEKIARTMLRNAISGSKMSSAMGERLQNDIIRRSEDDGTLLNFSGIELIPVHSSTSGIDVLMPPRPCGQSAYTARSTLKIDNILDVNIWLWRKRPRKEYQEHYNGNSEKFPQPFIIANENEEQMAELPPLVAAWLSILYDILTIAEPEAGSGVVNSELRYSGEIVEIHHEVVGKSGNHYKSDLALSWPLPEWSTFLAYDVFRRRWLNFRKSIMETFGGQAKSEDLPIRLLAAGWTARVLETFKSLNPNPGPNAYKGAYDLIDRLLAFEMDVLCFETEDENTEKKPEELEEARMKKESAIINFDQNVMKAAATLYSEIKELESTPPQKRAPENPDNQELRLVTRNWLEKKLPYLLSYLYVPDKGKSPNNTGEELKSRCEELVEHIIKNGETLKYDLATHWEENHSFILYDLEAELLKRIPEVIEQWNEEEKWKEEKEENKKQPPISEHQKCRNYLKSITPFDDLHRLWEN